MRYAIAILLAAPIMAAAQAPALPRMPDGKPNLQGIWQVLNTASWDIQDHPARLGVPGGQGVVEGNELPYRPEALAKKRQNFENRSSSMSCISPTRHGSIAPAISTARD